jgi:hypothetical protein
MQIAGGGNFDLGITTNSGVQDSILVPVSTEETRIVVPPSKDAGLFTGGTVFYEDGRCVLKENINPIGSYTSRSADRKIDQTTEAFERLTAKSAGVIAPLYIGRFEYDVPDQFGEPQTAILMLVPSYGQRFDARLLMPLTAYLTGQAPPAGQEFGDVLDAFYQDSLMPRMTAIGHGISIVHNTTDMVHHQLTAGNTDALIAPGRRLVSYITDWDTTTKPKDQDRLGSQALDLSIAMESASAVAIRLARQEAIDTDTAAKLILYTGLALLKGYFGVHDVTTLEHIHVPDIVTVASSTTDIDKKVELVESWLAKR